MIFVDANVFMYAVGTPHRHKKASAALLEAIAEGSLDAIIDAETLQEILHRYRAIGRWKEGRRLYDLVRKVIPTVFGVGAEVLDEARLLLDAHPALTARDALHVAAFNQSAARMFCSYDRDFDRIPGLGRVEPPSLLRSA